MMESKYHVWINDDMKHNLEGAEEFLQREFPGVLAIRKHQSYDELMNTLVDGGYLDWLMEPNQSPADIPPPDLVIQDYIFSPVVEAGVIAFERALEYIVEYFPDAKVVISTSQESFERVQSRLQKRGLSFPVIDKICRHNSPANATVREIIAKELQQRGYTLETSPEG